MTEPNQATPGEPVEDSAPPPEQTQAGWKPPSSPRRTIVFGSILVVGVLAILYAWGLPPFNFARQMTDNAYVRGQTTIIAPQVSGYVTDVLVQDFQHVEAGQILARIDDSTYRQRVAQNDATIAAQNATLSNSQQSQRSAEAQVRLQDASVFNAQAQLQRALADMRRVNELVDAGSVSLRERDQTRAALHQAQAAVSQAQAQRQIALEQVRTVSVGRSGLKAGVANAEAAMNQSRLDLDRTVIRAPRAGSLGEVSVRVGQLVNPGTQLMYLVPEVHWVIANFKEAQTAKIRKGQPATLRID
ncbi:MAG: HlyD family secretion protein, partial [Proteobacteria bacterium]|nr:HlyD family secretion protein [Pseudomonadota bacterium]